MHRFNLIRSGALILLLATMMPVLGGCLFKSREPEPPTTSSIQYLPRNSASSVWENCRLSMVNKDAGGWDTNVAEDFIYLVDSEAREANPGPHWDNWGKETEMGFINNWYGANVTIEADLLDTEYNTPVGDGSLAQWDLIYYITVTSNVTDPPSVTNYRGRAELEFTLQGSYWYLSLWRDLNGEEDPETGNLLGTMGMLRGAFRP